ncbi:hypothetical protein QFC20_003493 [Naganishia adeliensis]|uniref:Uncharacterized protein n=1 Tax=Naganishia adeliensis TaxID=92952 RepID=A0ACC2WCM9_9TREE|nr:hypothetical protein QFC20_003493 [Naganishia adeliensis]
MSSLRSAQAIRAVTRSTRFSPAQYTRVGASRTAHGQEVSCDHHSRHRQHHSGRRNHKERISHGAIPVLSFFFSSLFGAGSDDTPDLTPSKYTTHRVLSVKRISPQHVLIDIQISERSKDEFGNRGGADGKDSSTKGGILDIWHVYVKSPDLQIERPYTPINDVQKDGYIRLLVKRVKGGEVGRYIHSLGEGDDIEIRGPIKTVSVPTQSLDHLTMISTGTGVAPFLQLICKIANIPTETTLTDNSSLTSVNRLKLSLIQYFPRNNHVTTAEVPLGDAQSRSITDSLPAEEFSDADSSVDAGPDIIRHPDVLSPVVRKHLSLIVDSLTASQKAAELSMAGPASEGAVEKGSWFGWLSSSGSAPDARCKSSAADAKVYDGKMEDSRVGVMACLPVQSLIPLAGPQYPMGRTKPPIAGVLGSMGFTRDNVWIL